MLQLVAATGVLATITVRGVPNPSRDLDHDALFCVQEVDSDGSRRTHLEGDLRLWPRETRFTYDAQKAAFEDGFAAGVEEQLSEHRNTFST